MFLFSVAPPHAYFKGITSECVMYSATEGAGQKALLFILFFGSKKAFVCTLAVSETTLITLVAKSGARTAISLSI